MGIGAPTRQQVKDIYWRDIKALTPKEWVDTISETELSLITKWGAELRLIGLDVPQRAEGLSWDFFKVDEYASCKAGLWDANLRPALADRKGRCDFFGVPDFIGPAQGEYRDMCRRGQSGLDPEWADFAWGSGDILPASELESMRSTMDPRLFEQETTGAFIVPGGLAFPYFSRERHVAKCQYDPALPLRWTLDFNVNPMCSCLCQQTPDRHVRVLREYELPDTVATQAAQAFVLDCNAAGRKIDQVFVYGDPAGRGRSTASATIDQTSWTMVFNRLAQEGVRFTRMVRGASVSIASTVSAVNALCLNAAGESRLTIDPSCRSLIKGLESALAQTDMEEFHSLAAFRYYAEREFPVLSGAVNNRLMIA